MYDQFSADYDHFVNWNARLAAELPFIEQQLNALSSEPGKPLRILDAACGTGIHAIALAQKGALAAGADLSAGMIDRARANAEAAGAAVRFEVAGFGRLAETFGRGAFDGLLCLGNSIPHLLSSSALASALEDFAACLAPGGLLLVQNRNFERVLSQKERWMEPQSDREERREWVFVRFYDFEPEGLLAFHVLTLKREEDGPWVQQIATTRLRPILQAELSSALVQAGFSRLAWYGDLRGAPYHPDQSGNLVVAARKAFR
jgi:SAM-dependent methyltransferase